MRQRCLLLPLMFKIVVEILANAEMQEKEFLKQTGRNKTCEHECDCVHSPKGLEIFSW